MTEYHQEAQKTKYAQTYRLAAKIYKQYLAKFSDNPHAYNLRFYYAEILFTLQDYAGAAKQYLKVVHVDPDGKYSLTAAYDAILAYEKLAAIDRGDLKVQKATGKQKINEKKAKGAVTYKATFRKASKNDKAEAIPKWESQADRGRGRLREDRPGLEGQAQGGPDQEEARRAQRRRDRRPLQGRVPALQPSPLQRGGQALRAHHPQVA